MACDYLFSLRPIPLSDTVCKCTVPVLFGMARAIGRSSDDEEALISKMFRIEKPTFVDVEEENDNLKKSFTTFRAILPRTMSSHIITPDSPSSPSGLQVHIYQKDLLSKIFKHKIAIHDLNMCYGYSKLLSH